MTTSTAFEHRVEKLKDACRKARVKLTPQRLEIFREVVSSLEHPDAEAVFLGVQKRMPTVSLDTVYRTLWLLSEMGLIRTLGPRRESIRFDPNLEHHHHYVCTQCGLARDFESPLLDALSIPESIRRMGSVEATQVEVRGVCAECAAERARADRKGRSERGRTEGAPAAGRSAEHRSGASRPTRSRG